MSTTLPAPLIHIPLYCWHKAPDYAMRSMVEQHLACLESYFAHGNTYDLLVTTNDPRPFEIFQAYKNKSEHNFELRFVTRDELLAVFKTDQSRANNTSCVRTIFSKFYPILKREAETIIHVDFDTLFLTKVDLTPLLVSDIGLVDANQLMTKEQRWRPTPNQSKFFRLPESASPRWNWINSGVFSVQRRGFEILADEISHYLENLKHAVVYGIHKHTDEIVMNALAIRESDAVAVIPDYRYNFLAYFLKHDPTWTTSAKIIHFHSLKPESFWYREGELKHRCEDEVQANRVNEDLYLAVLLWFRHFHAACAGLPYLFPLLAAIPRDVVENELAIRCGSRPAESRDCA